ARAVLRVLVDRLRHVGRRIAARIVGDAAVGPAEIAQLRLPRADVAGELVHEHDRNAGADLLVIELHSVVGRHMRHASLHSVAVQLILIPALSTMSFHIGTSRAIRAASSCGPSGRTSKLALSIFSRTSALRMIASTSLARRSITGCGVPAGASSICVVSTTASAIPASAMVGTPGSSGHGPAPVCTSGRSWPPCTMPIMPATA